MLTVVPAGQASDFTKHTYELLLDLLSNQWTASNPPKANINFATNFQDLSKEYHIICKPAISNINPKVLGAKRWKFVDYVNVFIWAFGINYEINHYLLQQEVQRILLANANGLAQGAQLQIAQQFQPMTPYTDQNLVNRIADPTLAMGTMGQVMIFYHKVNVNLFQFTNSVGGGATVPATFDSSTSGSTVFTGGP